MSDASKKEKCQSASRIWLQSKKTDVAYMQGRRQSASQWHSEHKERRKAWKQTWSKTSVTYRARVKVAKAKRRSLIVNNGGTFKPCEWIELCAMYKQRCLCCKELKPLTVDHIIPLSKGGSNSIENIQPLCFQCNSKKRDKHIDFRQEFAL
jgi:5-methylcytosine-specific restriction endonuclease McrA